MRFTDGKLVFEGDLQEIGDNLIYGFLGCIWDFFITPFSRNLSANWQRIDQFVLWNKTPVLNVFH